MSNPAERIAEDDYESNNDSSPVTGSFTDNSYVKETRSSLKDHVPVQRDNDQLDDPIQPPYSNSAQQLGKHFTWLLLHWTGSSRTIEQDENEAIDESNIMSRDRLRHAKPQTSNQYSEGPEEDDLPAEA